MAHWSQQEKEVLQHHVTHNPDNLSDAMERAAEELGRTTAACNYKWYSEVRHMEQKMSTNGNGDKIKFVNRKNTLRQKEEPSDVEQAFDTLFSQLDEQAQKQFVLRKLSTFM